MDKSRPVFQASNWLKVCIDNITKRARQLAQNTWSMHRYECVTKPTQNEPRFINIKQIGTQKIKEHDNCRDL